MIAKIEQTIDHVKHRAELCETVGYKHGITKLVARLPKDLADRVLALPTATEYENQRRIQIMREATSRDEVEKQIGIPRKSLYTWLHRRPETRDLWAALPPRHTGRTTTPEQVVARRMKTVREQKTLSEAANRLKMSQNDLERWLHEHGFGSEATRLRAAQKSLRRSTGNMTGLNVEIVERDPLTWAKAVLNTPPDLRHYFGPPPVERVSEERRVVEVAPKYRGVKL